MIILCDTCSVLMVLRIAPDMFIDARFGCATIPEVRDELFKTQKFKTKYPWRTNYKSNIKPLSRAVVDSEDVALQFSAISSLIGVGITNSETGRYVDLSSTDMHVIACASANGYGISSIDKNLVFLAKEQFDIKNTSPLELVNDWIEAGLIQWDERLQMIMADWEKCGEAEQPIEQVRRFQSLTGCRYQGS